MRRVLYALSPLFLFAIYQYGLRVLLLTAVVFAAGILTEYIIEKSRNKKVSEAVLVTCGIYVLALPATIPLWTAVVGIVFAVAIAKGIYGGFGRNIFNPAIAGRMFIWISFPSILMTRWAEPGGFGAGMADAMSADAVSAATPLGMLAEGELPALTDLFLGFHASSMGEASVLLILLAGAYLLVTKTANWRLMLSTIVSAAAFTALMYYAGITTSLVPHYALMSGSLMYVTVFMVTDPVSAPKNSNSQFVYGVIVGLVTVLVRTFADFPEGTSFGLLVGNTFASLLDEIFNGLKRRAKAKAADVGATT
ncbi:MAG: RnfABCDGE type electron transport complex subunit D [Spirochaetaceae bacterium]|nr:MAG: RnfABCDGE type electron transport complex subunit D [Spirochaetaceae bacterium]